MELHTTPDLAFAHHKFRFAVDVCIELNVNPTKADQNVRGFTSLPHGTGKVVRIAALVPDDMVEAALAAGATYAGDKVS